MKLNAEQTRNLSTYLTRNRFCVTRQDERESLRIEGETGDGDWDASGYRSVVAFIQRGLGDQAELVRQVLGNAAKVQNDNHLKYSVLLFSFGWDDGMLHGKGRSLSGGLNRCDGWVKELCELASTDTGPVPQKTPSLFPPAVSKRVPLKVRGEDLLIFFCKDRCGSMTEEARLHYAKPLKHAVWIYCEEDKADMELGVREATMKTQANATQVKETTCSEPERQRQVGTASCTLDRSRGLEAEFTADLTGGILNPLLEAVKADHTLSLNIRANCVNIYYRGGNLLKITELSTHRYGFDFDGKYLKSTGLARLGISPQDIVSLPRKITVKDFDGVGSWVRHIPVLQAVMNVWFGENPHLEREFQQLVERMNNRNPSTDYFICDIEYTNVSG